MSLTQGLTQESSLINLPDELLFLISSVLEPLDLLNLSLTCKRFLPFLKDPALWKVLCLRDISTSWKEIYKKCSSYATQYQFIFTVFDSKRNILYKEIDSRMFPNKGLAVIHAWHRYKYYGKIKSIPIIYSLDEFSDKFLRSENVHIEANAQCFNFRIWDHVVDSLIRRTSRKNKPLGPTMTRSEMISGARMGVEYFQNNLEPDFSERIEINDHIVNKFL